ncbi:MAG: hypothetical protein ABI237_19105 [Ginsengibacter sp.]
MEERNNKSIHILNTSSNLLGICFIVLTSLKVLNLTGKTLIDEFTAVAIFMFMASSLLSFLSLKSNSEKSYRYEKIADIIFLLGLFSLFIITMFITFNILK